MKALTFCEFGGPEVLTLSEVADPQILSDEVLVEIKAAGLNFADIYRRRGHYTLVGPSPYILGYEGSGVVAAVGSAVQDFTIGDRVAFGDVPRANAERVKAPAKKLVLLPDSVSFEQAAALMLQGMTAHYLTHDSYNLKKGDTALIHSAAGGVGQYLLQIAKIKGARSIAVLSSADKVATAKNAGADEVIVSKNENFVDAARKLTGGQGVDVVYDAVGTSLLESLKAARVRGHVVVYGNANGPCPPVDASVLMKESKTLSGGDLWDYVADPRELKLRSEQLFTWVAEGRLRIPIAARYPLAQGAEAHRFLESRKALGKILLIPQAFY